LHNLKISQNFQKVTPKNPVTPPISSQKLIGSNF